MGNKNSYVARLFGIHSVSVCILTILSLSYCDNRNDLYQIKEIRISYLAGNINASIPFNCKDVEQADYGIRIDTVISTQNQLKIVEYAVKAVNKSNFERKKSECDIRLVCKITFFDNRKLQICLGDSCVLWNNDKYFTNSNLQYSIKRICGYYNYFSKEDLLHYSTEIQQFGIPDDYEYISTYNSSK